MSIRSSYQCDGPGESISKNVTNDSSFQNYTRQANYTVLAIQADSYLSKLST